MPKITIDGQELDAPAGMTIIQAAEMLGIEIPHFCYHARLNIAGNCRMCLVEVDNVPKPVASCAYPVADNMVIHTKGEMTRQAREGVMEFLLINHPLDCPICDQGGECDLQDQAMAYGRDTSRYDLQKRAVPDKHMGPLIKTFMNRCIHCTRCIRFVQDVAGIPELGTIGRGEHMEIVSYLDQSLTSELSGNVIDLCPVGALTSRPYAYKGRPWELTKTETIDVMDAVGSNIRVDAYGQKVMRVLPRLHEDINEEWISDKTRFACDGLQVQRLDRPYVRVQGKLQPASWEEAFEVIAKKLNEVEGNTIGAVAGDQADVETMLLLKEFLQSLGSQNFDCRQDQAAHDPSYRSHYLFNTTIAGIEEADLCLLIGTHPRYEAPLINARIRKRYLTGQMEIARIGGVLPEKYELTYRVTELGDDPSILEALISGQHDFVHKLKQAKKPMLILGQQVLTRKDGEALLAFAGLLAETYNFIQPEWNGFNVLHTAASRVGGLDIGFVSDRKKDDLAVLYLLGADELDFSALKDTFIIYQGHHGDKGAHHADIILPGATYTEKNATYVNTEGRVQQTQIATFPPGEAKEDWRIIRALSEACGKPLPYDTIDEIRERMAEVNSVFGILDSIQPAKWHSFGGPGKLSSAKILPWSGNFYMTDPISRHSVTMAKCSEALGFKGDAHVA